MQNNLQFFAGVCKNVNTPKTLAGDGGIQVTRLLRDNLLRRRILLSKHNLEQLIMNISHNNASCKQNELATSNELANLSANKNEQRSLQRSHSRIVCEQLQKLIELAEDSDCKIVPPVYQPIVEVREGDQ